MFDAELGREHARSCFARPRDFAEVGPRTATYADAALEELERLQRDAPGMIQALLDGGNQGARQLNADAFQGLREIIQNADDLGATSVRFGTRQNGGRRQLLMVHNGSPVELMHVLPMIYPFLSTKRGHARLKGRFGVGLKTLSRLGGGLTVHSAPFHFSSRDHLAVRTSVEEAILGFYDPSLLETMFTLDLDDDIDKGFLGGWFSEWSPSDLIFLDTVREVTLHDLDVGQTTSVVAITETGRREALELQIVGGPANTERRVFEIGGRTWVRYVAQVSVPEGKRRTDKATGDTTPVGIALPLNGDSTGRIHVALPTRISTGAAFSLDAQFDPATSREELVGDAWNRWLVRVSAEVLGALAIHLAHNESHVAWYAVPVGAATNSTSTWLNERFASEWRKAVALFARDERLIGGRLASGLSNFSYCDSETEGLLDEHDHLATVGLPMLPLHVRDGRGRWREVLLAIGVSRAIGLSDLVSACDDDRFGEKGAEWFLSVAGRCLRVDRDDLLMEVPWIPLADGERTSAQAHAAASELLVLIAPDDELAVRHGLFRVAHPLLNEPAFADVQQWLLNGMNLVKSVEPRDVLAVFARRYRVTPHEASREDLLRIRDLFGLLDEREPIELGSAVGRALLLEAVEYVADPNGVVRSERLRATPHELYLPPSIEDEPDGWSRAAGETPGLRWASPAYANLFKVSGRRNAGQTLGRIRAAKRFLMLLGAATVPRVNGVDTPVGPSLPRLQAAARQRVGSAVGILEGDHISPDLDRVIADLTTADRRRSRRAGRRRGEQGRDRGVALFRCLAANWSVLEKKSTTYAIRVSRRGGRLVDVPATWVARLADAPWLANTAGGPSRPRELAIATKVTTAIYDDPAKFAAGLGAGDASSPLARALGMEVDPPASELVRAIERLREETSASIGGDVLRLYRALAGHCPSGSAVPSPEARVGDLTVNALRAKFGISRKRRGLIAGHATTLQGADWFAPTTVFSGKDIFHGRQPFVIADRDLAPLWSALNISAPSISDCVRELCRIAKEEHTVERGAVLIDIYRHLDRLVEKASASERRALADLPLLCDGTWITSRPVYIAEQPGLSIPVVHLWSAPCAVATIRSLVAALGLEPLPIANRPVSEVYGASEQLQVRFSTALRILQADLARDDERSYRALEPWTRLVPLEIQVHPNNGLLVRALPAETTGVTVAVRAHADVTLPAVHVDSEEVIGRIEFGGHALARFADPTRRREVALAWVSAWATSADVIEHESIELARDEASSDLDELAARFDRLKKADGRRRVTLPKKTAAGAINSEPLKVEVRRLKNLPDEFAFTLTLREEEGASKGPQSRNSAPLRTEPPSPSTEKRSKPAPASAHRLYDSRQLQDRAWAYVQAALDDGAIQLDDYQADRGVGADGAIEWKTFVEMKSFAREAPNEVTFTEAEFRRARERKGKFLLVVVSGLEDGFDTEVQVYADPLGTLPWVPKGTVSIGGLKGGRAMILTQVARESPEVTRAASEDMAA